MDSTLLQLAGLSLGRLSAAEALLLQAVEEGREAVPVLDLPFEIRSIVLEWLCTSPEAMVKIHRHGVSLCDFRITGSFDLIHAHVRFPLQFRNCVFLEPIWMKGARLRSLSFRGGSVRGLNADSVSIETNVLMVQGFQSVGEVTFRGAVIRGDFRSDGSTFLSEQSCALVCDRIKVAGNVSLSMTHAISTYNGEVRFSGAEVGGNLDCDEAVFRNPLGTALDASRIVTGGSVFLRRSQSRGEIILGASKIGAFLDCRGAVLASQGERTLNAERALIGSHALLDGEFGCDKVHFLATTVQGGLRCRMSKIGKLDLRHAFVQGPFEWADMIEPASSLIDFRDARLESIKDDEASWPSPGHLLLDGFRFERFSDCDSDVRKRLAWIELDTSNSAYAYRQLSAVYERGGRSDLSKKVLFAFEKLARTRHVGRAAKTWNFVLRWTIGYGYELWRAGILMVLLTLVGAGLAVVGYRTKLIAPTDKDANTVFVATGRTPTQYPRFSASMYSVEHSLPGVNLGIASTWSADTTAQWPRHRGFEPVIRFWFWLQTLFGWVLSIFFVAGISGVVKSPR